MNIQKSEIKSLTAQDLGRRIEDKIEATKAEFHRLEGVKAGLQNDVLPGIESVKSYWTKDLHESKVTPEIAQAVFKALDQCAGCVRNLIDRSEVRMQIENGKIQGFQLSQGECESVFQEEVRKLKALSEALEQGKIEVEDNRPPVRAAGEHPGPSIAQMRREEEAKDLKPKIKGTRKKKMDS